MEKDYINKLAKYFSENTLCYQCPDKINKKCNQDDNKEKCLTHWTEFLEKIANN